MTSERLVDASPIWSPRGDQIVFRSNRSSTIGIELYLTTSSPGGATQRILGLEDVGPKTPSNVIPCCWLPDGQVVFYQATMDAGYGIWTMSVEQKSPKAILDTQSNEVQAAVSPDGRRMAYASDQSGRYEIYVQDFPAGGQRTLVSTNGGMQPQWRGDGRELYYIQGDGSFMQVAVRAGERFDAAAPTTLFKTDSAHAQPIPDGLRAGGRRKAFPDEGPVNETPPAITVVLNWPALLKRTETPR